MTTYAGLNITLDTGVEVISASTVTGSWVAGNVTDTYKPTYGADTDHLPAAQIGMTVLAEATPIPPAAAIPSGITSVSGGWNIGGDVYKKNMPQFPVTLPSGNITGSVTNTNTPSYGADTDHLPAAQEGINVYTDVGISPIPDIAIGTVSD